MILTRQGNKKIISQNILQYFPKHNTYIELFFGAGGMFFNKPLALNNICNDYDNDVYNLWYEVKFNKENLIKELETLFIHNKIWEEYKDKKPIDKTLRASLFLMYSNFGYMGRPQSLGYSASCNYKDMIIERIDKTFNLLKDVLFMNYDFRSVIEKIKFRTDKEKENTFIYSDPPYLGTMDYGYNWCEQDAIDCFETTFNSGFKAAMSEFDNEFILNQAKERELNIIYIGERKNMKNRRTEILITNYKNNAPTLF